MLMERNVFVVEYGPSRRKCVSSRARLVSKPALVYLSLRSFHAMRFPNCFSLVPVFTQRGGYVDGDALTRWDNSPVTRTTSSCGRLVRLLIAKHHRSEFEGTVQERCLKLHPEEA